MQNMCIRLGAVRIPSANSARRHIDIHVNGCEIQLQIDHAADTTIISHANWVKIGCPKMVKPQFSVNAANNLPVEIIGECKAEFKSRGKSINGIFHVVKGSDPNLLGSLLLYQLGLFDVPISSYAVEDSKDHMNSLHNSTSARIESTTKVASNVHSITVLPLKDEFQCKSQRVFSKISGKRTKFWHSANNKPHFIVRSKCSTNALKHTYSKLKGEGTDTCSVLDNDQYPYYPMQFSAFSSNSTPVKVMPVQPMRTKMDILHPRSIVHAGSSDVVLMTMCKSQHVLPLLSCEPRASAPEGSTNCSEFYNQSSRSKKIPKLKDK